MTDSNIRPFLMFEGTAEEAMNFYVSLFPCSKIQGLDRYKAVGPGSEAAYDRPASRSAARTCYARTATGSTG
jgi:predicted 3-demethylubiquinone-9 3-methyltransferase (glyoxalase superfamily)